MTSSTRKHIAVCFILFQAVYFTIWFAAMKDLSGQHAKNSSSDLVNCTLAPEIMKSCPLIPNGLVGKISVDKHPLEWSDIQDKYHMVVNGSHRPGHCTARSKVAILIPYRDRDSHLRIFLNNMHALLMKQQLDYGIFVIELDKNIPFNRGFLFNIGFKEASSVYDFDCFVFHDVDLLPLNDLNLYSCPDQPRHMSVAIDKYKYRLLYANNFGGVSSLTKEQFTTVNGFSNWYFDWGGEDDDLYNRIVSSKMTISRVMHGVARYTMLSHKQAVTNPHRETILKAGKQRMKNDGLNSLHYKIVEKTYRKLFVHIKVSIDRKELTNFIQNIQTFVKNNNPTNSSSRASHKPPRKLRRNLRRKINPRVKKRQTSSNR